MKKIIGFVWILLCIVSMTACSNEKSNELRGLSYLSYTDIDTVCDNEDIARRGTKLLTDLSENNELLLSIIIDSEIEMTKDELGEYDHLIIVSKSWIERFDSMNNITEMSIDALSSEMKEFFDVQISMFLQAGMEKEYMLASYSGKGLFSLPANAIFGADDPVTVNNPLLLIVDNPATVLKSTAFLLPLTSSGNVLFTNYNTADDLLKKYKLDEYATVEKYK